MKLTNIKYKANYYALLILAFVIPLERRLIAPAIILFLVTSLLNFSKDLKAKKSLLLFCFIYIPYCASVLFVENTSIGLADLTTRLSLFLLPLSFFFSNLDLKKSLTSFFTAFIEGCAVVVGLSLINTVLLFYFSMDISLFFYKGITLYMHPSYLAMMLSMAISILYYYLFNKNDGFKLSPKLSIALIICFSVFVVMLSSKTGLITLLLIHGCAIGYWMYRYRALIKGILLLLVLGALVLGTYSYSSVFQSRINELFSLAESQPKGSSSTLARKEIWLISLDLIKEKPLIGYGNGDTKQRLVQEYENRNLEYIAKKELNAHNQFLQTSLTLGIVVGLILLAMLLVPMYISIKQKQTIYLIFLLLILVNFCTESILERQVGITFYALFNSILFSYYSFYKLSSSET